MKIFIIRIDIFDIVKNISLRNKMNIFVLLKNKPFYFFIKYHTVILKLIKNCCFNKYYINENLNSYILCNFSILASPQTPYYALNGLNKS